MNQGQKELPGFDVLLPWASRLRRCPHMGSMPPEVDPVLSRFNNLQQARIGISNADCIGTKTYEFDNSEERNGAWAYS